MYNSTTTTTNNNILQRHRRVPCFKMVCLRCAASTRAAAFLLKIPEMSIESLDESKISMWSLGLKHICRVFLFEIETLEP